MTRISRAIAAALLCLGMASGCSTTAAPGEKARADGPAASSGAAGGSARRPPGGPDGESVGAGTAERKPSHPPVDYTPSWPDRTTRSPGGHLVDTCVPKALRKAATTLTTSDGVHLSALELGDGPNGVLLAHEQGYNICSFLDIGRELASRGYHVVIPEYRNHGASQKLPENTHILRDAEAALAELRHVGARRVFLGGASCGGSTAAVAGADGRLPVVGLLMMSSPARCGGVDAVAAARRISAPSLFVVSPGDMRGAVEKQVREVYAASAAAKKKLVVERNGRHGTDMIRRGGARGAALRDEVIDFVASCYAPAR